MVKKSNATFRKNADIFFDYCNSKSIPLTIVSAGVGDIIEEMLIQNIQNASFDNVKIISNFFEYNENNHLIQLKQNLIHVFNKNEALLEDKEHLKRINNRTNVLLMGDAEGDHNMAESLENVENILKIGFLNQNIEKDLEKFLNLFDVVLIKDSSLNVPIKILNFLLN
jgi:cytosolic 5'-nucleotidase 3